MSVQFCSSFSNVALHWYYLFPPLLIWLQQMGNNYVVYQIMQYTRYQCCQDCWTRSVFIWSCSGIRYVVITYSNLMLYVSQWSAEMHKNMSLILRYDYFEYYWLEKVGSSRRRRVRKFRVLDVSAIFVRPAGGIPIPVCRIPNSVFRIPNPKNPDPIELQTQFQHEDFGHEKMNINPCYNWQTEQTWWFTEQMWQACTVDLL